METVQLYCSLTATCWAQNSNKLSTYLVIQTPDLIFQLGHKSLAGETAENIAKVWVSDIHFSPLISNPVILSQRAVWSSMACPWYIHFSSAKCHCLLPLTPSSIPSETQICLYQLQNCNTALCSGSWIYSLPPWEGNLSFIIGKKSDPWFRVVEPAVQVASGSVGQLDSLCFSYSSPSTSHQLTKTDWCTQSLVLSVEQQQQIQEGRISLLPLFSDCMWRKW